MNAILLKLFWYKVFVHWKLKLLGFLMDSLIHFKGRNLKQILIYCGWVPVVNALFYPLKNSILVWERWLQRNPNIIEGKGGGGGTGDTPGFRYCQRASRAKMVSLRGGQLNATRSIAADRKILDDVRCRFPGDFSGVRFHVTFAISFSESALLCPAEGSRPLRTRLVTFDDLCCKQTNHQSSDNVLCHTTVLVRTTTRYFKFALTYKCYFPFAVWNSTSLRFKNVKSRRIRAILKPRAWQ